MRPDVELATSHVARFYAPAFRFRLYSARDADLRKIFVKSRHRLGTEVVTSTRRCARVARGTLHNRICPLTGVSTSCRSVRSGYDLLEHFSAS